METFSLFGDNAAKKGNEAKKKNGERKTGKYAIIRHFLQKRKLAYDLQYYWAGGRPVGVAGTAPDGAAH